jgi:hypothetical protein
MKNLTTAIYGKLSGSALETAIGGRLFKGQAPEGTDYPYVVFFVASDVPERTFTEDYENVIVQFSLFSIASGTTEIEDIYSDLKTLYDEQSFSITGSTLIWMRRSQAVFLVEDHTTPSGTQSVWHYAVDFDVKTSLD